MRSKPRRSRVLAAKATVAIAATCLALAGCGGASSAPSGGPLTVAMLTAFTGSSAFFGAGAQAACTVAAKVIAHGGGVLGHQLSCRLVNDQDDPADAVPAVNQLLATASNLAVVDGPVDETPTVMPILNAAHVPVFSLLGDPRFDHSTSAYFFRLISSDALGGTALGYFAATHGYTHAAAVFTSDSGAQSSAGPAIAAYKKAGGSLATNLTLQPGATDYRTEAAALVKAKPDALITEMDASTAASFLQEVAQLSGGRLPPLIGTEKLTHGSFMQTLTKAVGPQAVSAYRTVTQTQSAPDAGYQDFWRTILSLGAKVQNPKQYQTDYYTQSLYDAIVVSSLAMIEAHSVTPQNWSHLIPGLLNGAAGDVEVSTFAQGKAALAAGKKIHYVGAIGPLKLNQYHNTVTPFSIERITPGTFKPVVVGQIPASALSSAGA